VPVNLDYGRNGTPPPRFNGKRIATAALMFLAGIVAASLLAATVVSLVRGSRWAIILGCVGGAAGGMFIAVWRDLRRQFREATS